MEGKKETAQTDIDAGSCTVDRTILYVRLPRELDHHNAEAVRRQADPDAGTVYDPAAGV